MRIASRIVALVITVIVLAVLAALFIVAVPLFIILVSLAIVVTIIGYVFSKFRKKKKTASAKSYIDVEYKVKE